MPVSSSVGMRQLASLRRKQLADGDDVGGDEPAEAEAEGGRDGQQAHFGLGDDKARDRRRLGERADQHGRQSPTRSVIQPQNCRLKKAQTRSTRQHDRAAPRRKPQVAAQRNQMRGRHRPSARQHRKAAPASETEGEVGRQSQHPVALRTRLRALPALAVSGAGRKNSKGERHHHDGDDETDS